MFSKEFLSKIPPLSCILAIDEENGIGKNNKIPWNIPSDMQYFNKITQSYCVYEGLNVVIMGKNTWESIPKKYKPLCDRINIVISSTLETNLDDILKHAIKYDCYSILNKEIIVKNIESAFDAIEQLQKFSNIDEIFIIGGKKLYDMVFDLPHIITGKLHVSHIKGKFECDVKVNFNEYFFDVIDEFPLQSNDGDVRVYVSKKNLEELVYLNTLNDLINANNIKLTRNGNVLCGFSTRFVFDLNKSFPLLTTKKMFLRGIFEELKFFLLGKTDSKILETMGVNIWKANTSKEYLESVGLDHYIEGDMGPMYGFQLRHYGAEYKGCLHDYTNEGFDQFAHILNLLKFDQQSRRIIMTTYNPAQVSQGVLPPCHGISIQFAIENINKLSCIMYQRSADMFLGIPFNIASYALLVHIICALVNNSSDYTGNQLVPGNLTMVLGDYHIYEQHIKVVREQITRIPNAFPQLVINKKITSVEDLNYDDIVISNYKCYKSLKADMIA